jgi:hypothetical protein
MQSASKKPTAKEQPKNGRSRFFREVSNNQSDNDMKKKPQNQNFMVTNLQIS